MGWEYTKYTINSNFLHQPFVKTHQNDVSDMFLAWCCQPFRDLARPTCQSKIARGWLRPLKGDVILNSYSFFLYKKKWKYCIFGWTVLRAPSSDLHDSKAPYTFIFRCFHRFSFWGSRCYSEFAIYIPKSLKNGSFIIILLCICSILR